MQSEVVLKLADSGERQDVVDVVDKDGRGSGLVWTGSEQGVSN